MLSFDFKSISCYFIGRLKSKRYCAGPAPKNFVASYNEAKRGKRVWRFPWVSTVNSLEAVFATKTTRGLPSDQGYGPQQKAAGESDEMQAERR